MARLLNHMLSRPAVTEAIRVSLFVGTCPNAINQGSAFRPAAGVEWSKALLNYAVPYLVASYSAATALQR
jgi:hypothetical protein